jgi:hypothetical protein
MMFTIVCFIFILYTYSFIDSGLVLSNNIFLSSIFTTLHNFYQSYRLFFAFFYFIFVSIFYFLYIKILKKNDFYTHINSRIVLIPFILIFAYPAFSYDLFNYITTAKVYFYYHENPYVVMPIEITNEPNLAFTRASNKVALYGPIWIWFTFIPYSMGFANIWLSIISFKLVNYALYLLMIIIIWKKTKQWQNVVFFACNPLILIETLVNGHNDMFMMILAVIGLILFQKSKILKILGTMVVLSSILTKGATIITIPLLFVHISLNQIWKFFSIGMFIMFLLTPLREELYPWYAIWFLIPLSFVSWKEWSVIRGGAIVLSFGLLLRHMPYIATYNYGGNGPILRIIVTIIPLFIYFIYIFYRNKLSFSHKLK